MWSKFFLVLFFSFIYSITTEAQKSCSRTEIYQLMKLINDQHYQPKKIDDVWSQKLFYKFLGELDEYHLFFLKSDLKNFSNDEFKLDDQIISKNLIFIEKIYPIYKNRLLRSSLILQNLKKKSLKFSATDKFIPHHLDSLNYAETEEELSLRWEQFLKLNVLLREYQVLSDSTAAKPPLQDIYNKIIDKKIAYVKNEIQDIRSSSALNYLLARQIPPLFDAHSAYMSYSDFQNFQSVTSAEDFAFGITISLNSSGLFEIDKISPGSPAWKCNKLNRGDIITHLQWQDQPKIEIADLDFEHVMNMMDQGKNQPLYFTVRTATGIVHTVSLVKEKINSEENFVKGFLLTTATNKKYGYISLPSFYTRWETENSLGCANDVATELFKLKKHNIEGLIFDLRNNGGGSLKEGIELSGIFVNEGPMMIKAQRNLPLEVLKDWNRGTAYSGPMIVMINGHSASASELMASTLQDFHSAVIVGTNSYGKATGQAIMPINPLNKSKIDSLQSGYASITMMKLYRVTGKSNQLRGVQPDIYLPDPYTHLYERESNEPEALAMDTVVKKVYYMPLAALPIAMLKKKSESRIEGSPSFQKIKILAEQHKNIFSPFDQIVDLQSANVQRLYRQHNQWIQDVTSQTKIESKLYQVTSVEAKNEDWKSSSTDQDQEQFFIDKIKKDIFIEESFLILNDLLTK